MSTEFLVEGLSIALTKGETLKSAINSFVNAGYNPAEVERAVRILQTKRVPQQPLQKPTLNSPSVKNLQIGTGNLSNYNQKKPFPKKAIIITLIICLILLLGGLIWLLLF